MSPTDTSEKGLEALIEAGYVRGESPTTIVKPTVLIQRSSFAFSGKHNRRRSPGWKRLTVRFSRISFSIVSSTRFSPGGLWRCYATASRPGRLRWRCSTRKRIILYVNTQNRGNICRPIFLKKIPAP